MSEVNFPNKEQYGELEGLNWSIFVKYDDGSNDVQDFYLVSKTTGNWTHFKDWNSTSSPINYFNYIEWENTNPETRKRLGLKYYWMTYMDKCGQLACLADPQHWLG